MWFKPWPVLALTLAATVHAVPRTTNSTCSGGSHSGVKTGRSVSIESCAALSKALTTQPTPIVPAELAYKCLVSVPVDTEGDLQQIEQLKLFLAWQSDLSFQKDPPPSYVNDPVDVMRSLDVISQELRLETYGDEYNVQRDIVKAVEHARNGHIYYYSDIYLGVMTFMRPQDAVLVSISDDGVKLPKVYTYADIALATEDPSHLPSAVLYINGYDTVRYLERLQDYSDRNDPDSRYDAMFWNQQAALSIGASATDSYGGFFSVEYDGPTTILQFENGTTSETTNLAEVAGDWTDIDSGHAFFERFCTGRPASSERSTNTSTSSSSTAAVATPTASGYPYPIVMNAQKSVQGYFLNGTAYENVAVLAIPTFLNMGFTSVTTPGTNSVAQREAQAAVEKFLAKCTAAGKRKLIVDVRANPGGDGIVAEDTFKQLFPSQEPYIASRARAHPAEKQFVKGVAGLIESSSLQMANSSEYAIDRLQVATMGDYTANLKLDDEAFDSWEDFYGPTYFHDDLHTHAFRENFSDPDSYGYWGFSVTGYLNRTNAIKPQPFASDDILLLTDGVCASSCALLAELLRVQGGVKVLKMGGLPHSGVTTSVGGVKGTLELGFAAIQGYANVIYELSSPDAKSSYNSTPLGRILNAKQAITRAVTEVTGPAASVNGRDLLRMGGDDKMPTQFLFDEADGRLFYTAEMVLDVTKTWEGVVDAWWGGKGLVGLSNTTNPALQATTTAAYISAGLQPRDGENCTDFGIGSYCSGDSSTDSSAASGGPIGWAKFVLVILTAAGAALVL